MFPRIEKDLGETLYREYFFPCRTLELIARDGTKRKFVEYSEATDNGHDLRRDGVKPEMALINAVRRLLTEGTDVFFFDQNDIGVNSHVLIEGKFYWLKCKDISEAWPNHYWTKTRKPIVGFKTITKDGKSVVPTQSNRAMYYEIGKQYSVDEATMLDEINGFFFSQQLEKALYYEKEGTQTCMVVASGLILIKNRWDDMCAQNLTLVRKLTKNDIKLLTPTIEVPIAFWNGTNWDSHDEAFYNEYIWQL